MVRQHSLRCVPVLAFLAVAVGCDRQTPLAPPHAETFSIQSGGGKIAFTSSRDGNNEIYVMNPDGTGQTRLTNDPGSDSYPAWSPDGSRIAFTSTRGGHNDIYVMNADGSGVTRLTTSTSSFGSQQPAWCGNKIAFASDFGLPMFPDIYLMNDDGTGVTRLTTAASFDEFPAWSPTCDRIAFNEDPFGGHDAIYVINADGTGLTPLAADASHNDFPAWSPDGTRIAFSSDRDDYGNSTEIYVMNADGSQQTRLTVRSGFHLYHFPAWSPDGTQIAFQTDATASNGTYVMNADGSGVTQLADGITYDRPAWSGPTPNGGVVFESNWATGTGVDARVIMDSASATPWDIWEDGSQGVLQGGAHIMEVVNGIAPPGYSHSLRVQQRGECDNCWADIRKNPFIATGNTDYYFRFYFMTSDVMGTAAGWVDHGVEPWIWWEQHGDVLYLSKYEGPSGWGLTLILGGNAAIADGGDGHGGVYPIVRWFLVGEDGVGAPLQVLSYNTWYRLEYFVDFTSTGHVQVHPRVYDAAGNLLYQDADFVQQDPGNECGGYGDWTLALWYTRTSSCNPGNDFQVNRRPDPLQAGTTLQSLVMGNNGQQSAQNTGLFWYYAGVQIRTDTWPGP